MDKSTDCIVGDRVCVERDDLGMIGRPVPTTGWILSVAALSRY